MKEREEFYANLATVNTLLQSQWEKLPRVSFPLLDGQGPVFEPFAKIGLLFTKNLDRIRDAYKTAGVAEGLWEAALAPAGSRRGWMCLPRPGSKLALLRNSFGLCVGTTLTTQVEADTPSPTSTRPTPRLRSTSATRRFGLADPRPRRGGRSGWWERGCATRSLEAVSDAARPDGAQPPRSSARVPRGRATPLPPP